jgi:hypothetical protein
MARVKSRENDRRRGSATGTAGYGSFWQAHALGG